MGNINRNNKIVLHVACFRCQFNLNTIVCYLFVMDKIKIKEKYLDSLSPKDLYVKFDNLKTAIQDVLQAYWP